MVVEAHILWGGLGNTPKLGIMHFEDAGDPADIQSCLEGLLNNIKAAQVNTYTSTLANEYYVRNDVTGALENVGTWPTPPGTFTGASTAQPVPDASQVLMRWSTEAIVNGRRLRGRTYVPGLAVDKLSNGNLTGGTLSSFVLWANTYANDVARPCVWSRTGGVTSLITAGSAWGELAVQRGRRG